MNRTIVIVNVTAILAIVAAGGALAGEPRSFRLDGLDAYADGEFDSIAVGPLGDATLAARPDSVWGPEPGVLWSLAVARGRVHVGLSDPARVVRVGDGDPEEIFRGESDEWVTALAPGPDGTLLAGLSPSGRVIALDGNRIVWDEDVGGGYVWALALDDRGALWAGAGNPGRILRRDGPDRWSTAHDTGDDPVRSLTALPGGGVAAGTGREGRVLVIRPDRRAFALLDADEAEIVGLAVAPDGGLWALAARAGGPRPGAAKATRDGAEAADGSEGESETAEPSSAGGPSMTVQTGAGSATVRVSAPAGPSGGSLYLVGADGDVETVWESAKAPPYALGIGPDGRPWVGLGGDGRIVRIGPDGDAGLVTRIPSETATAIVARADGEVWIGASGDARVVRLAASPAARGTFRSAPIDAGWIADWGRVHWRAAADGGASATVELRSGNVADPDETWSDWSRVALTDGTGSAAAGVPPARWAQVRLVLDGAGGSRPSVRRFEWFYLPRNRAPRIALVGVEPSGVAWGRQNGSSPDRTRPLVADDPVARRVAEEVGRRPRPAPIRKSYEPGVRTVRWTAIDPDGDRLRFDLELRREGDEAWMPLATGIEDDFFGWDARGAVDGRYRVRLTADDGIDNADGRRKRTRRVSDVFEIDGTPPTVEAVAGGSAWTVRVRDPEGRVAALEFATDGEDWRRVDPEDGVADAEEESFRVPRPRGSAAVRVRATDVCGNVRVVVLPDGR